MMLKKPETYEEAKKIIKYSADDKVTRRKATKIALLRAGFMGALAAGAFSVAAVGSYLLIPAGVIAGIELIPYFKYLNNRKKKKNDTYFASKTTSEIIKEANDYVEWRNELKAKGLLQGQEFDV